MSGVVSSLAARVAVYEPPHVLTGPFRVHGAEGAGRVATLAAALRPDNAIITLVARSVRGGGEGVDEGEADGFVAER